MGTVVGYGAHAMIAGGAAGGDAKRVPRFQLQEFHLPEFQVVSGSGVASARVAGNALVGTALRRSAAVLLGEEPTPALAGAAAAVVDVVSAGFIHSHAWTDRRCQHRGTIGRWG